MRFLKGPPDEHLRGSLRFWKSGLLGSRRLELRALYEVYRFSRDTKYATVAIHRKVPVLAFLDDEHYSSPDSQNTGLSSKVLEEPFGGLRALEGSGFRA